MALEDPVLPEDPVQKLISHLRHVMLGLAARLRDPGFVMMNNVWPAPLTFIPAAYGEHQAFALFAHERILLDEQGREVL